MNPDELLPLIDRIHATLKSQQKKINFDIYDEDDIKQEIYFMILKAEPYFDEEKGEPFPFFYNFVRNRWKTLKRDKAETNQAKMALLGAQQIEGDVELKEGDIWISVEGKLKKVDSIIPAELRGDYLKLKGGAKISYKSKYLILNFIKATLDGQKEGEQ